MKKRIFTLMAVLVSLCVMIFASVPATLAYIMDGTGTIVNTFAPDPSVIVDPITTAVNINKTVFNVGEKAIGPEDFRFLLRDTVSGKEYTATSNVFGIASIPLTYTIEDAGKTFVYTLREIDDKRTGVTYSDLLYVVRVTIVDGKHGLSAEIQIDGTDTNVAAFRNVYDSDVPVEPPETGDQQHPVIYLALVVGSLVAMAILLNTRRRVQ